MGVKASLTLGREEKPLVKGSVGLYIVVEKIYLMMRSCSLFHGVWDPLKPYAFVVLGNTRGFVCKEEEIFQDSLERKNTIAI